MNQVTNILVPVDFSEASKKAMHYGATLALQFHARLVAAHIVPSFAAFTDAIAGDPGAFERRVFAAAEQKLPAEIPASCRMNTLSIVRGGDVRDELLNIVESEKIDLIVMGTHGRRPLERFLLGSIAENMLRKAPVPILTVSLHGSEEVTESPLEVRFQRVVYATDLSEAGDAGFHYCVELVRTLGADMTMLHVLDVKDSAAFDNDAKIRADLEAHLHKMIEEEGCIGLPLRTEIGHGIPYRRILKFAEEVSADLLVINLQSKDLLERALLGSTADRVIRSSRIPVLSIPVLTARHALRALNTANESSVRISDVNIA